MVGLIFVKIARGKKRRATLLFSKYAVVHKAKDGLAFAFRVADLRNKSNLLETRIRAHLITWVKCEESDKLGSDLKMGNYFLRKEKLKVSYAIKPCFLTNSYKTLLLLGISRWWG